MNPSSRNHHRPTTRLVTGAGRYQHRIEAQKRWGIGRFVRAAQHDQTLGSVSVLSLRRHQRPKLHVRVVPLEALQPPRSGEQHEHDSVAAGQDFRRHLLGHELGVRRPSSPCSDLRRDRRQRSPGSRAVPLIRNAASERSAVPLRARCRARSVVLKESCSRTAEGQRSTAQTLPLPQASARGRPCQSSRSSTKASSFSSSFTLSAPSSLVMRTSSARTASSSRLKSRPPRAAMKTRTFRRSRSSGRR